MSRPATIAPAEPHELEAIMALERAGFDAASQWSRESWWQELHGTDRCVLVARPGLGSSEPDESDAADPHGCRRARPASADLVGVAALRLAGDVADLNRVLVASAHRGRGVGRALVEAALAWAGRHAVRMLLEVEAGNLPALALYRRLGFADLSRREDYYGTGRHALVLQHDLADAGVAVRNGPARTGDGTGMEEPIA